VDIAAFLDEHERKDLLRFLTCGSVDDGKSTLIGRLLYDSKLIFQDQLSALHRDSERQGNAGEGEIDYALLLDGLRAEREQGITIDVAYRYFSTPRRKFIIADTPGHEQYTRNMATGASTANLAVILVDASQGILTQTRRHSFIVSLLGIRHVILAVNKMDLVGYDREAFDRIRGEYDEFISQLDIPDVTYIPVSALRGDNVVACSERMPWYGGPSLLEILENVDIAQDRNLSDLRFPVQCVLRPDHAFRGFAGTVASGVVRPGDRVKALPSLKETCVKRIVTADGDLQQAFAPQAVVLELEDEIDVSSGEMLVHVGSVPHVSTHFEAVVVWMSESPLAVGKTYTVRQTTRITKARVANLLYAVDVNTLQRNQATELDLNAFGRCALSTNQPLFYDEYARNRETGSFILIDEVTNSTVGAGMIVPTVTPGSEGGAGAARDLEQRVERREFLWERGLVTPTHRATRNKHAGKAVILTGRKGVGKRDLARQLELHLFQAGFSAYYLGVSNLIEGLDADLGSNFWDRDEHIRRIGELARIMTDAGLIFVSSLDNIDDYDFETLKLLSFPNEVLLVNVGERTLRDHRSIIDIPAGENAVEALNSILRELSRHQVLPDYQI